MEDRGIFLLRWGGGGGWGKTGEGKGKGREVVHFMKFFQLPEGF